jgi:UDP-N-acetylmuramyl-tripeptide synthetase
MLELTCPNAAAAWLKGRVTEALRTDSRKVVAGDGFLAWPGAAVDARQHVSSVLKSGAVACLVEMAGAEPYQFENPAVAGYRNLKVASGPIAAAYFEHPSDRLDVIAVTGTNGKTSTAWWLAHALSGLTLVDPIACGFVGTLGIGMARSTGGTISPRLELTSNGLTTPDPVLLQQGLREFQDAGLRACALEASSIGIEEHRLDGTRIRVAVFTNFTQDHLDYHGSMHAYWESKARLFTWPGLAAAAINIDDEKGQELAAELTASAAHANPIDVWTLSCERAARLQAQDIAHSERGLSFTVVENELRLPVKTRLTGRFNVSNLLGVIAAMRVLGVPLTACVAACEALHPVPGRMESQGGSELNPLVIVDYAHTPDAVSKALTALRQVAEQRGGQLWCVLGCGGNRDASKRPVMGSIAWQLSDRLIVTSDNPRAESPQTIADQMLAGIANTANVSVQLDRALAIRDAVNQADSRDIVLVAGKGHEDYQEVAGVKRPFSDHLQVQLALKARVLAANAPQGVLG